MRSHTQSAVIEPNRKRIAGFISYKPLISDLSVLIVCNKTGGTIKGDIKKNDTCPANEGCPTFALSFVCLSNVVGTWIVFGQWNFQVEG